MEANLDFAGWLKKRMAVLAVVVGIIVSISVPTVYLAISFHRDEQYAIKSSELLSAKFVESISNNPTFWISDVSKYVWIFSEQAKKDVSVIRVSSNDLGIIENKYASKPGIHPIYASSDIVYNNKKFGDVGVTLNVDNHIYTAGLLLIVFTLIGIFTGTALYKLPARIVNSAEEEVTSAYQQLSSNISERELVEEQLRKSEAKFRSYVNQSVDAIFVVDDSGQCIEVNPAGCLLLGYSKKQLINKNFRDLLAPEHQNRRRALFQFRDLLRAGRTMGEAILIKKDESTVVVEIHAASLGNNRHIGMVRDITERKRLQHEVARLDQLNLVGEMAAAIGHEIRNPMTTARGFIQLLSNKEHCEQYKEFFDIIIDELDRANSIITEFLSMAKNKRIELKQHNLNSIIQAMYPLIIADATMTEKEVNLELCEIPDLYLDDKEIRQVILNLARNGLEAMTSHGTLTIKTCTDGEDVVMAISDEGRGVEQGMLEKLGTPFFSTKENGTGLGLAVCYSIAARHGANISVDTCSAGTTFYVRFEKGEKSPC